MSTPANCPCDEFVFPVARKIDAGLPELPRQLAAFPEWRRAILQSIARKPTLAQWRAREIGDFGLLLVEMAAYVYDVVAFYDQVFAQEAYVRTASQRADLRQLVSILGYLPRPAVSALVKLALFADGRKPLALPSGAGFRSGAFGSEAPQVFELLEPASIDPLANEWRLLPVRPATIGAAPAAGVDALLCLPGSVVARVNDIVVVATPAGAVARAVAAVSAHTGDDGQLYTRLAFDQPVTIASQTAMTSVAVWGGSTAGSLWKAPAVGSPPAVISGSQIVLDGVNRRIRVGEFIALTKGTDRRCFRVTAVSEGQRTLLAALSSTITDSASKVTTLLSPDITTGATTLTLDQGVNAGAATNWGAADAPSITLHYGFVRAATPVREFAMALSRDDSLLIKWPADHPAASPARFLLEDRNGDGVLAAGTLSFSSHQLGVDNTAVWSEPLVTPVRAFGNVVAAARGESVHAELLGVGDIRQQRQTFKLKKKPLAYLPAGNAGNEAGVASTLQVFVGGIQWSERRSFFDATDEDRIYIVRHDEKGDTYVTFGGGARLATGAIVTADYRFGAGAASPPAGSIAQLAKPVPGLKAVRNPVPAAGGADAESAAELSVLAPRSALLLGRAVSIADFEVAAATVPGVRAVACAWKWNSQRQRPLVQIDYIGEAGLAEIINEKLHNLTDPTVPIAIAQAVPLTSRVALQLELDPTYIAMQVVNAVRDRLTLPLTGFLVPEQAGVDRPLFESALFRVIASVDGVARVTGLVWGTGAFPAYGLKPGPGKYFAFPPGNVVINGNADYV